MNTIKYKTYVLLIFCLVFITSCASVSVSPTEIANADFGSEPINYENDIKNLMSSLLKDPLSATYRFAKPKKGVTQDGWAVGGKKHFGYIVPVGINAKNSYGGYTGEKLYYFLFSEGMVMEVTSLFNIGMGKYLE